MDPMSYHLFLLDAQVLLVHQLLVQYLRRNMGAAQIRLGRVLVRRRRCGQFSHQMRMD